VSAGRTPRLLPSSAVRPGARRAGVPGTLACPGRGKAPLRDAQRGSTGNADVVGVGAGRRLSGCYLVATVILATPTSISSWTAVVPNVVFSSAAASGLMCTVVPSRMALSPSVWRGFSEPP